jgi:S-formylglutathione hydrolase FrmB
MLKNCFMMVAVVTVCLVGWFSISLPVHSQSGGPPRRIENPTTIQVTGGSRIEFKEFSSPSLGKQIRCSVFLPPSYDESTKEYPVIYFLHGMFNDDTSWVVNRYGNIPEIIEKLVVSGEVPEFIMVHPQGQNSFYTDSLDGKRPFERFLREDLIKYVEGNFRVRKDRVSRAIGGTSMGGYGALKLAMKNPKMFSSALAGSPIVLLGDDPTSLWADRSSRFGQYFSGLFSEVFGDPFDKRHWADNSLEQLARNAKLDGLRIRMLYGTADRYNERIPMEKGIRTLSKILEDRGYDPGLHVYEGEPHGWNLMVQHMEESVRFLTSSF